MLGIPLAVAIGTCLVLSNVLARVPAQFRRQEPAMVWWLLMPCFNLVWAFFVHPRVSQSLRNYFKSVGRQDVGDCGEALGVTYAALSACSLIPFLGALAWLGSIVVLIIFLLKVNELKAQIPPDAGNLIQPVPQPYYPGQSGV